MMTTQQYRHALKRLGLTQTEAARLLSIEPRSSRRYANGERAVPGSVSILLCLMMAGIVSAADIDKVCKKLER